jgi:mono/diheme cytochrome c family protein
MRTLTLFLTFAFVLFYACTPEKKEAENTDVVEEKALVGFVELTDPLDEQLITQGTEIFIGKCTKCHAIDTVEFIVPAMAGVTNRRSPEWIMNMIINVDEMLKRDPVAADLLRKHRRVMPDPELSVADTRAVLEFLRNNDMEQLGEKDRGAQK